MLDVERMVAKNTMPQSQDQGTGTNLENHPVIRTLYDHNDVSKWGEGGGEGEGIYVAISMGDGNLNVYKALLWFTKLRSANGKILNILQLST